MVGGNVIADLLVRVSTDVRGAERGLDLLGQAVTGAARRMLFVGAAAALIGATATGALFSIVGAAANFEQGMANVNAVMDITQQEFEDLSNLAKDLGRNTIFSATEAAMGIEALAKAGLTYTDIMTGAAQGTLDLAAATGTDLNEAALLTATTLQVFGLEGSEATHVADVFAAAANKTAADIHDMTYAMSQSSNVAALFGLSFEETAATLAMFADAGLRGSDAGTSLRTMLISLTGKSEKAKAALAGIGFSIDEFYASAEPMVYLTETLTNGMKDMTDAQRAATLFTIFGTDALRAAQILYEGGADSLKGYIDELNDEGAASRMAEERTKTLNGALEKLGGAWEDLKIELGTFLLPVITLIVLQLDKLIEMFAAAPKPIKLTVVVLLVLLAALLPLGIAILTVTFAVNALAVSFAFLLGPIGLVILAIGLLTAAYLTNFLGFRTFVNWIASKGLQVIKYLIKHWRDVILVIGAAFGPLGLLVALFIRSVNWVRVLDIAIVAITVGFTILGNIIEIVRRAFLYFTSQGINPLSAALMAIPSLLHTLKSGFDPFDEILEALGDVFFNLGQAIEAFINGDWRTGFSELGQFFEAVIRLIINIILFLPRTLAAIAQDLTGIPFSDWLENFLSIVENAIPIIISLFQFFAGAVGEVATSVVFWIANSLIPAIQNMWERADHYIDRTTEKFKEISATVVEVATAVYTWFTDTLVNWVLDMYNGAKPHVDSFITKVKEIATSVTEVAVDVGNKIIGIWTIIQELYQKAKDPLGQITGAFRFIKQAAVELRDKLVEIKDDILGFFDEVKSKIDALPLDKLGDFIDMLRSIDAEDLNPLNWGGGPPPVGGMGGDVEDWGDATEFAAPFYTLLDFVLPMVMRDIREFLTNEWIGVRQEALTILGSMRTGVANAWLAIRDDSEVIIKSIRESAQLEFFGMQRDIGGGGGVFGHMDGLRNNIANAWIGAKSDTTTLVFAIRNAAVNEFIGMRNAIVGGGGGGGGIMESLRTDIGVALVLTRDTAKQQAFAIRNAIVNEFVGLKNDLASAMRLVRSAIMDPLTELQWGENSAGAKASAIGNAIGAGLYNGMQQWATSIANLAAAIVRNALLAAQLEAQVTSPSKKAIYISSMIAKGFMLPLEKLANEAAYVMKDITGSLFPSIPSTVPAPVAAGMTAGGNTIINIEVIVHGEENGEDIANVTARAIVSELRLRAPVRRNA